MDPRSSDHAIQGSAVGMSLYKFVDYSSLLGQLGGPLHVRFPDIWGFHQSPTTVQCCGVYC